MELGTLHLKERNFLVQIIHDHHHQGERRRHKKSETDQVQRTCKTGKRVPGTKGINILVPWEKEADNHQNRTDSNQFLLKRELRNDLSEAWVWHMRVLKNTKVTIEQELAFCKRKIIYRNTQKIIRDYPNSKFLLEYRRVSSLRDHPP